MRQPPLLHRRTTALLLLLAAPAAAQSRAPEPYPVARLTGPVTIDGRRTEPAWNAVTPLPLTTYRPVYRAPATQRTEIRIAYDVDAIYLMADCYDSDPAKILAGSMLRDADSRSDFLNVMFDTFMDHRTGVIFSTTPGGNRIDWAVYDDAEGDNWFTNAWDTPWELGVVRDDTGWHAEYRIPFSSLRFEAPGGRAVMGLSVNRLVARLNERVGFPDYEPVAPAAAFKPSLAFPIVLEGVRPRREVRLTPFVLGRSERPGPAGPATENRFTAGGDFKLAVTPYLTLDVTANTDFAQTEADDQRINLGRFPLFFPERRTFFLERASTFDLRTGESDLLFHSRRIGLTGDGQPLPLLGGARLVGRTRGWDLGFLDVQTDAGAGTPGSNSSVARVRRALAGGRSFLGAMTTLHIDNSGAVNAVAALDGLARVGDWVLTAAVADQLAGAADVASRHGGFLPDGALRVALQRPRTRGLGVRFAAGSIGIGYSPALGYVERNDIRRVDGVFTLGFQSDRSKLFRVLTPGISLSAIQGNSTSRFEGSQVGARWQVETGSGISLSAGVVHAEDDLTAGFELGKGVTVPAGRYRADALELDFEPGMGEKLAFTGSLRTGQFYDGRRTSLRIAPELLLAPHLAVAGEYTFDKLDFPSRAQHARWHVAQLRAQVAINVHASVGVVTQLNTGADLGALQLRFRYNVREGQDLWAVVGRQFDAGGRAPFDPSRQTLTLKYTHAISH